MAYRIGAFECNHVSVMSGNHVTAAMQWAVAMELIAAPISATDALEPEAQWMASAAKKT